MPCSRWSGSPGRTIYPRRPIGATKPAKRLVRIEARFEWSDADRDREDAPPTLGDIIETTEKLTGRPIERAHVDKGYRGHNASNPHRETRALRRRSAIEPVIGHMKTDGHLGRCHLKGREGAALRRLIKPGVTVDVGANIGWMTLNMAEATGGPSRHRLRGV